MDPAHFYCDYRINIVMGEKVFISFNCVVLDVMQVKIGSRSQALTERIEALEIFSE